MYRLILLLVILINSFAISIDLNIEKNLKQNDINTRLVLVKYYLDRNITKAKKYNDEVLKIDKYNKIALKNKKNIFLMQNLKKIIKNQNIDKFYQNLYLKNAYDYIKKLSVYIPIIASDYPKLITAKIYYWDGNYKKAKAILSYVNNTDSLDYVDLKGNICYYEGNYKCAVNNLFVLYHTTYKLDYAYKLIQSYIYLGKFDKANKLLYKLLKIEPNDEKLKQFDTTLTKERLKKINTLKEKYKKSGSFKDLQNLVYVLFSLDQNKEAYKLLQEYIKLHPDDTNAKYWYAKYLSWDGNNKKALKILTKLLDISSDYKIKLLTAKIYSWNGDFDRAINYLNDIIANCQDKNLVIKAKEIKGLIYYWQHNYKKAKRLLKGINTPEAKEALMVMNGNIKPLIKKYKLLYNKDKTNLDYILKIAQYSEMVGDIDTAIKFYEKYDTIKKNLNVAHSLATLYLKKKNLYKAFSYYEYWAYQKGDVKSLYELAKAYYYAGFPKSALSVIKDILDMDKYNKKALELKATILRYSPKFTQQNSQKTIQDIFAEKNSKLLETGNRLYFNGFYDDSLKYYKEYLLDNPNDYEIRERYAYALEFSSKYKEASGEFFLLTWNKQDCNTFYHNGYNLEKANKKKLAKKAYKKALELASTPAPKFIVNFINEWKKAWESQDINKYKKFYISKYANNKFWLLRKESIFKNVKFISLYLANISLIKKDKNIYTIRFYQQYTTNKKQDKGYKTLKLICKNKKCLIKNEKWIKAKFIPDNHQCYNFVKLRLENIDKIKSIFFLKKKLILQ